MPHFYALITFSCFATSSTTATATSTTTRATTSAPATTANSYSNDNNSGAASAKSLSYTTGSSVRLRRKNARKKRVENGMANLTTYTNIFSP